MVKNFLIYRSSAGSGKTRTLAKEYLKLALRHRHDYFRHILAVTFTNKATQEMKDRILAYLSDFAHGRPNELAGELRQELNLDEPTFRQQSQEALSEILHKYDRFGISTIDAFFQKVIRSFTRESGLMGDYRLEVEHDAVVEEVVDNLIDELGSNKELTEWVIEFAKENLKNEKAWDVRYNLMSFANEIFREEYKAIEEQVIATTSAPGFFRDMRDRLWSQKNFFHSNVTPLAKEALAIIKQNDFQASDFKHGKNSGVVTFFKTFAYKRNLSDYSEPSDRIRNEFTVAENWPSKSTNRASDVFKLARDKLIPIIESLLSFYDQHYKASLSAEVALRNMYVFGLIADISRKLKEYKDDNNLMLLADAPKFLNGVIQDSDTPFIYEKVGSFYRNYLIDEFQDTSGLQWKNFLPLVTNGLDQGYPSLVVGDVKQAIYRWRGGDLNLLQREIERHVGSERVEVKELDSNFRSSKNIIEFNNALFQAAASIVSKTTGASIPQEAYHDVMQKTSKQHEGFVNILFLQEDKSDPDKKKWRDVALEHVPMLLEKLQTAGVSLRDVAILVRKNEEGQRIASYLLEYKNSDKAKEHCRYDVVSNELLRIDTAATVNLLLGAMRYLYNPDDSIARAQLGFEYARLHQTGSSLSQVFTVTEQVFFERQLPESFTKAKTSLRKLALIELTETLIEIFDLGKHQGELAYLQAFQNLVLDFYAREQNDLGAFLQWWEDNKNKKSVQVSGEIDAAQIVTIHKSKGLQYRYVIIPFCGWGMDHDTWQSPNLWVKADEQPFHEIGYLPVKYSGTLKRTIFSDYYQEENARSWLDNLNLLYVAFTRAEQGLFIVAPHREVKNADKSVGGLLFDCLMESDSLKSGWLSAESEWLRGALLNDQHTPGGGSPEAVHLGCYAAYKWRDKLVIRQNGAGYFSGSSSESRQKVNYGIHVHSVLSRIKYADEVVPALNEMIRDGLIKTEDKEQLMRELNELLENEQIRKWFDHGWKVKTEVPILLPEGTESRIDRLMIKDKQAVIVDFKTGERSKRDQQQVIEYMNTLKRMNFLDVEGYVLYVKDKEVVSVATGKHKVVRKKDDNQLGLF